MELVSARTYISKNLRLRKMNETPGSKASGDQCMCQWEEVNCVSIIIEPDSVLLLSWLQSFVGFRGSAIISFPRSPVILECDSQNFEDRFFLFVFDAFHSSWFTPVDGEFCFFLSKNCFHNF